MSTATRREVLTVAAVTVTLPMLESALGGLRSAHAAAMTPASKPAPEKPGWFATKLKPADLKDNQFAQVEGHTIVISRSGKAASALTNICTHKNCTMAPVADQKVLTCKCHKSEFNLDGSVGKAPAKTPLQHFAIRVNDAGLIEVDPGTKVAAADKNFAITLT